MSDTKHSPAPWTAKSNPDDKGHDFPNVQDANGNPIANVLDCMSPRGSYNWALIEQAPALLEALKSLLDSKVERDPILWHVARKAARAIIAKAEIE